MTFACQGVISVVSRFPHRHSQAKKVICFWEKANTSCILQVERLYKKVQLRIISAIMSQCFHVKQLSSPGAWIVLWQYIYHRCPAELQGLWFTNFIDFSILNLGINNSLHNTANILTVHLLLICILHIFYSTTSFFSYRLYMARAVIKVDFWVLSI